MNIDHYIPHSTSWLVKFPPEKSASKDVIYRNICVVRNGTVLTFEIPVWEGKTYVPLGEQVYNVQLMLRARKNAQLKVHHSKSAIPQTAARAAAAGGVAEAGVGAVGGALAGAV